MKILVYVEARGGSVKPAGFEALTGARKVADLTGGSVHAVVMGEGANSWTDIVAKYGPDEVLVFDNAELTGYNPDAYRDVMMKAAKEVDAKVVLMTATTLGKDLAPMCAARLDSSYLPDCTTVEYSEGRLTVKRPVYAGRCLMTLTASGWPCVMTLRPKAFTAKETEREAPQVKAMDVDLSSVRIKLLETKAAGGEMLDVTEADVVVAGGRGLKEAANFKLLEDLAVTLGGAVGASRAVVDADWRPHSEQVGQTGKVVSPTLYFAVGISGAIQHLAGMKTAKTIVAINKDADAPIFKFADYGIVGDALEVMPALNEALKD